MDDCTLKSLEVKPGKLSPSFQKDITDYNVTVGSQVDSVTFRCETSDRGASYSISNSEGGKSVKVKEGEENNIKIEVTSEDGTTKAYWVHVRRLSAKDAALAGIELKDAAVNPSFTPDVLEYFGLLPCNTSSVTMVPTVHDAKASVKVNGAKPATAYQLNVGLTPLSIEVTSPDGSNVQVYTVFLVRKQIPIYIKFSDASKASKYVCPVSLSPLYQPVTVKGSQPMHTYSGPIIADFTRTSKVDPIGENPLELDWRLPNYDLDKEISEAMAFVPLLNGGYSEKMKLTDLGNHLKNFVQTPKFQAEKLKFDKNCPLTHTVEVRNWEKQLHQIFDETDAIKLEKLANEALEKYFSSLPVLGKALPAYAEGQSPVDHLDQSSYCLASAINSKNKDASLHLKLGMALEEKFFAEDVIGIRKEMNQSTAAAGTDLEAQESSMAEECDAICQLHGVPKGASVAAQLKAIDQEYHSLLDKGQSTKADHVQVLYAWKSKQASKDDAGGVGFSGAIGEQSSLRQAYFKYLDALSLDNSKAAHHFHVGRLLTVLGDYDKAIPRLEAAIGWNEQYDLARFYLGVALALKKGGPGNRGKDAVGYLLKGFEILLRANIDGALKPGETIREKKLNCDNLLHNSNIHLLQGLVQLGHLVKSTGVKDCMSSIDIWHTIALYASYAMTTTARGNTYHRLEQILMDVHSLLLQQLLENVKDNSAQIGPRCEWLSAIIKRSTVTHNVEILQLQLQTSQMLAQIQPCNSHALYLLGNAQLALYDFKPDSPGAEELLKDCKKSFMASISLEGKSSSGEPLPEITGQKWWKEKKLKGDDSSAAGKTQQPPSTTNKEAGSGTAGKSVPKPSAAAPAAPSNKGAAAARGTPSTRGAGGGKAIPAKAVPGKAGAPKTSPAAQVAEPEAKPEPAVAESETAAGEQSKTDESKLEPIFNRPSFQPRLGLARALSRGKQDLLESKQYYLEAISMAPNEHSAYIEVAEMLTEKDPLGAVDVYCRFPVPENPTFDDAYIFGEIVRLLFKAEKYDDPRLLSNMIALGKIMGFGYLEKYVQILQSKFKTDFLMQLYAGVNRKKVDDPIMQQFFKMKCWI